MPAKGQPGPQHNEETRKKISDGVRLAYKEKRLRHWAYTKSYIPKGFTGKHSEETKKKISESRKGKCLGNINGFTIGHVPYNKDKPHNVHTDEWRKKVSEANSGQNHWNWKGGKTEQSHKERNTSKYKTWRNSVYYRDNWTCQICHIKQQCFTITAHHIIPWAENESLRFIVDNGVTMCRKCHCAFHKPRNGTGKSPVAQLV